MATIREFYGFNTKRLAEQLADEFRFDGYTAEIVKEGRTWTLRVFPKDYGEVGPAINPGVETTGLSDGVPATPSEGGVKVLLDHIGQFESGGNYNAYFRHADNEDAPRFTDMTVAEVIDWQTEQINAGSPSSAVGRYQIIRGTLRGLVDSMGLDASTVLFDAATQDQMAVKLLEEKGLKDFLAGTRTAVEFANSVARVWAALPIVSDDFPDHKGRTGQKGASFYADDGLNKALVGVTSYLRAVETVVA